MLVLGGYCLKHHFRILRIAQDKLVGGLIGSQFVEINFLIQVGLRKFASGFRFVVCTVKETILIPAYSGKF